MFAAPPESGRPRVELAGTRQWLIERRRIGPVIRTLERVTDPLFRRAGLTLRQLLNYLAGGFRVVREEDYTARLETVAVR